MQFSRYALGSIPFQRRPVPLAQSRAGFISALKKIKQRGTGRRGATDIVIHQNKFIQLWMIERRLRTHRLRGKTLRFRGRIAIESGVFHLTAAGPESSADDFV